MVLEQHFPFDKRRVQSTYIIDRKYSYMFVREIIFYSCKTSPPIGCMVFELGPITDADHKLDARMGSK